MARRLFKDSPLSEPMTVRYQLDSNIYASVSYTITGSDNGLPPVQWQPIIWTIMVSCQLDSNTSTSLIQATAHHLFGDSPLSEPMMVCNQLDSSLKASVDYTITGSGIGPSPSSKYSIQENIYEGVKCSNGTQFVRPRFV